ncbi:cytidine deaminase [Mycoplasma sp. 1654_15]|uniref:cytidine deaminase n=1 Tax=Mycoplasma sp. 1654_15 TaxID=2725994 RepID=UPI0014491867|nr:cytidine deaminase [Mycoplasma sp. 1654_15]QJB71283.1 cytidine deaminase [Mycoplasma sp. 1654_15]
MLTELQKLLKKTYTPYSKFPVAAIIKDKLGNTWQGVNVENAAYPSGLCAERNALFSSITYGFVPGEIKEIHILANTEEFIKPCGSCLQVMIELMDYNAEVYLYLNNGNVQKRRLTDFLPLAFRKEFLD